MAESAAARPGGSEARVASSHVSPRPVSPRGLTLLLTRTVREAWSDRILGLSAEAGFWQLLSLPPLMLAVLGTFGFFAGPIGADNMAQIKQSILSGANRLLAPDIVATVVAPVVDKVLKGGRADVVSVGFVISLWAGSSATATFVNTITIAYGMRYQRSALRSRLLAFALYLIGVVGAVIVLPLLVLGPGEIVDLVPSLAALVRIAYWPVVALASMAGLATLYHLAIPVRTSWRRDVPGAAVAVLLWVAMSYVLREYIHAYVSKASAYGQLGAVVAALLFLYFTAMAVIFGAELNAEIDKLWPTPVTAEVRRREHDQVRALQERREAELEWARSEQLADTGEWWLRLRHRTGRIPPVDPSTPPPPGRRD
jgi:membrane protein